MKLMQIWKPSALVLLGIAAVGASAQTVDPFDAHCADVLLLQSKNVQADVGITQAQRDNMNGFAATHRAKMADLEKQYREQHKDVNAQVAQAYQAFKANILGQLTPAQGRRLREITLQGVGLAALRDQVVTAKVGMTQAQATKYDTIYKEGAKKFADTEQAAIAPILKPYEGKTAKTKEEAAKLDKEVQAKLLAVKKKVQPVLKQIRDKYDAQLRGVLTPPQTKNYQALLGKPFKPATTTGGK